MPRPNHAGSRPAGPGLSLNMMIAPTMAVACPCPPPEARAICGLGAAVVGQLRTLEDPAARQAWAGWFAWQRGAVCDACHVAGGYGPRNP